MYHYDIVDLEYIGVKMKRKSSLFYKLQEENMVKKAYSTTANKIS